MNIFWMRGGVWAITIAGVGGEFSKYINLIIIVQNEMKKIAIFSTRPTYIYLFFILI